MSARFAALPDSLDVPPITLKCGNGSGERGEVRRRMAGVQRESERDPTDKYLGFPPDPSEGPHLRGADSNSGTGYGYYPLRDFDDLLDEDGEGNA